MKNLLNNLNEQQVKAVTSKEKYIRVIAGAGVGKTRVLTYRIANLINNEKVFPSNILAITFTNKVAKEMKERATKLIKGPIDNLCIKTYHGFCVYFLRHEVQNISEISRNFIIYDDQDRKDKIKEAAIALEYAKGDKIISEAKKYIDYYKSIGVYPHEIDPDKSSFRYAREDELLKIYKVYESLKDDEKALDFDDLLIKTVQILTNFPEIRQKWSRYYKHLLIDEFQDTNDIQYKLVKLLMSDSTNLFVVGDPDQTIYSWRGANQDIILNLKNDFPGTVTIILDKNYRSTKRILAHANALISHNKLRVKKDLLTDNESGSEIEVFRAENPNDEATRVIKNIRILKTQDPNFKYSDVAILYRNNYASASFENKLAQNLIPYVIYGGIKFYERKEIKLAIAYFRSAAYLSENYGIDRILSTVKGIGEISINYLHEECKKRNLNLFDLISSFETEPCRLTLKNKVALINLANCLKRAHVRLQEGHEAPLAIFQDLLYESPFYDYIETLEEPEDREENVKSLFAQINEYFKENSEGSLVEFFDNAALATSQDDMHDSNKVQLMTVHTAKGLEFKYVFLVFLCADVFPSARSIGENPYNGMEEERRLCYVAFTRAMKKLFVSCNNGFSYISNKNTQPSQFFVESDLALNVNKNLDVNNEFRNRVQMSNGHQISTERKEMSLDSRNWHIGDALEHNKFGRGHVIDIIDNILVIDFSNFGIKKIVSYYIGIKKIYESEIDS